MALGSRGPWNVVTMMVNVAGERIAPPSPCTARMAIIWGPVAAKPAPMLAMVNIASPVMYTRRRPKMSAARPPSNRNPAKVSTYALTTHWALDGLKWRSRCMEGSATLTMETSRTTMNCAMQAMKRIIQSGA